MSFDPAQLAQVEDRRQDSPFVWLVEIPIPDEVSPEIARLTSHSESVSFDVNSSGEALVFTPRQLTIEPIREDSKATQQALSLTVSNADLGLLALVDAYDGLEGQTVRLMCVSLELLIPGSQFIDATGEIQQVSTTQRSLTFDLGRTDISRSRFPANRVQSDHCPFAYKGARCGYTGALPSCDKTLNGPNGCVTHDNASRFGGFPGVPRQR